MRTHAIHCDHCNALIDETLHVYQRKILVPHATYEGARDSWDFCSWEHMLAWSDEQRLRRLHTNRTRRSSKAETEDLEALRQELLTEVDARIAAVEPTLAPSD